MTQTVFHTLLTHADAAVSRKEFLSLAGRGLAVGVAASALASCQSSSSETPETAPSTGKPGTAAAVTAAAPGASSAAESPPAKVPTGGDKPIELEPIAAETERQHGPTPTPLPPDQRVGYAVVGLGHLTLDEILPAFGQCKKSRVVALVSGSPMKMQKVAQQYGVKPESCYTYADYDKLRDNPEVQAIYIVLPNSLHAEYTIRGAQAGKHILCEKPMANSVAECEAMITACKKARRKLMIAYRIQYEPTNRAAQKLVRDQRFGAVRLIQAVNAQKTANPKHWRHMRALAGGGTLPDNGLYCLNTARFLLGTEPIEVFGYTYSTPGDPRFKEVEELASWQMRFPEGIIVNCASEYNAHESRFYRVMADKGWINMENAFAYDGQQLSTSHAEGAQEQKTQLAVGVKNHFTTELDHFSGCVLDDHAPYTPGEEGLQDQRIMEAIYQSAREGRPVKLPAVKGTDAFRGPAPKDS